MKTPNSILEPCLGEFQGCLPEGNTIRLGTSILVPGAVLFIIQTDAFTEETAATAARSIQQQAREILKKNGFSRWVRTKLRT